MLTVLLGWHPGLASAGRVPHVPATGRVLGVAEVAVLLLCGAGAALISAYARLSLGIPGHAIIRSVFPMALGLALVPRRGAGFCMGSGALATVFCLRFLGLPQSGVGATTSLVLTGPLLDIALMGAASGWRLYLGFVSAGLVSNLVALVVRGGAKELLPLPLAGRPFAEWLAQAAFTYPLCGALAGLISSLPSGFDCEFAACRRRPRDFRWHRRHGYAPHARHQPGWPAPWFAAFNRIAGV